MPVTGLLFGLTAGLSGPGSAIAACASFICGAFWLRAELAWSGRYWLLHVVLKQDIISRPSNMTAELAAAILAVDDAYRANEASSEAHGVDASAEDGTLVEANSVALAEVPSGRVH